VWTARPGRRASLLLAEELDSKDGSFQRSRHEASGLDLGVSARGIRLCDLSHLVRVREVSHEPHVLRFHERTGDLAGIGRRRRHDEDGDLILRFRDDGLELGARTNPVGYDRQTYAGGEAPFVRASG